MDYGDQKTDRKLGRASLIVTCVSIVFFIGCIILSVNMFSWVTELMGADDMVTVLIGVFVMFIWFVIAVIPFIPMAFSMFAMYLAMLQFFKDKSLISVIGFLWAGISAMAMLITIVVTAFIIF